MTTNTPAWTFDLDQEMVDEIQEAFDPATTVADLKTLLDGKTPDEADALAREYFADYGHRLAERSLALGEEYADRTYETLLAAQERTGNDGWPFVPQRFMELMFLSSQPIYTLPIVENSAYRFVWKLALCETYQQIEAQLGEEAAERLPCQAGCIAATKQAFNKFGFDVEVTPEARMPDDEYCQFAAPRVPRQD
jgi:hypothetical protein